MIYYNIFSILQLLKHSFRTELFSLFALLNLGQLRIIENNPITNQTDLQLHHVQSQLCRFLNLKTDTKAQIQKSSLFL